MSHVFEGRNEKLIKLVQKHPELYDQQHTRYHDAKHKTKIWNTIGAFMEEDGLVCKSRWKNIRDQYRKNVKKHGTKMPPYKFSEYLSFLKDYTDGNEIEEHSSQSAFESDHDDFINELIMDKTDSTDLKDNGDTMIGSNTKKSTNRLIRKIMKTQNNHSSTDNENPVCVPRVMEFLLHQLEASQNVHPVDAFLNGIAPALKILNPYDWNQAKLEIFSIVHKYEMKMLTDPTPSYCPNQLT